MRSSQTYQYQDPKFSPQIPQTYYNLYNSPMTDQQNYESYSQQNNHELQKQNFYSNYQKNIEQNKEAYFYNNTPQNFKPPAYNNTFLNQTQYNYGNYYKEGTNQTQLGRELQNNNFNPNINRNIPNNQNTYIPSNNQPRMQAQFKNPAFERNEREFQKIRGDKEYSLKEKSKHNRYQNRDNSDEDSKYKRTRREEKRNRNISNHHYKVKRFSSSSSRSNSSVEVKYVSYSKKNKHPHWKKRKRSTSSSSESKSMSGSNSEIEITRSQKKKTLNFDIDNLAIVNNNQENFLKLNRNVERQVISYKILGNEKPLISQERNLFDKLKNFLPNEIKKNEIGLIELEKNDDKLNPPDINSNSKECFIVVDGEANIDLDQQNINANVANEKTIETQNNENIPADEKTDPLPEKKSDENELDEFNYENRYFIKNPTKICFRCHKVGHYEKTCTEELIWKIQCLNCLGDHRTMFCDSIVCFKCSKMGHKNKDCPEKLSKNCYNCRKFGHERHNCGIFDYNKNPYSHRNQISTEDQSLLTCFVCFQKGVNHVNCKKICVSKDKTVDDLYKDEINYSRQSYNDNWKNNRRMPYQDERKKLNYHKLDQHAIDSFNSLENF